jgi:hypothetical protein
MENDLVKLDNGAYGFIKAVIENVGAIIYRLDNDEYELVFNWVTIFTSSK